LYQFWKGGAVIWRFTEKSSTLARIEIHCEDLEQSESI